MPEFAASIEIDASPEFVFGFLTSTSGMTSWMGEWADLDPRQGGRFAVDIAGSPVRGEYLEVDPPHRVVVSWGYAGSDELPAGASTVAFTLTPIGTGTRVDLLHTHLPTSQLPGHAQGWAHFLGRLEQAGGGWPPGVDTWRPGNPAM